MVAMGIAQSAEALKWDKEELTNLYVVRGLTLQAIGNQFGVSRERIRQVMSRFCITRRVHGVHNRTGLRFPTLDEYLENNANRSKKLNPRTVRKYLPSRMPCSLCRTELTADKLHVHHICYPAKSANDILIFCPSCHKAHHMGKMTLANQVSAYNMFTLGTPVKGIATHFGVSIVAIRSCVLKIGYGNKSLAEASRLGSLFDLRVRLGIPQLQRRGRHKQNLIVK